MRAVVVRLVHVTLVAAAVSWSVAAQQPAPSQVTAQDLRDGVKNPTPGSPTRANYANHQIRLTTFAPDSDLRASRLRHGFGAVSPKLAVRASSERRRTSGSRRSASREGGQDYGGPT
jgi:hypothetical protein